MHLFSREHLAASSGIVGAAGPGATGFGLAAKRLRPRSVAVAFFGEGAINQGMLMESLNLAVVWHLPVLFVCKDDRWAISTRSPEVTGGDVVQRARAFGLPSVTVDGRDVLAVWQAAEEAVARAREGEGPSFLHATCTHLEGHFLGDLLLRLARRETLPPVGSLLRSVTSRQGASLGERLRSLAGVTGLIREAAADHERQENDPLSYARAQLEADVERLEALEAAVSDDVQQVVAAALD
jgi:pyruvate dehydrogenase E1 component alpha subunit